MRFIGIILFLLVAQAILFSLHYVAYRAAVSAFSLSGGALAVARYALVAFSVWFLIASILAMRWGGPVIDAFYAAAAVWLGALPYLFLAGILYFALAPFVPSGAHAVLFGTLCAIAGAVTVYGVWNAQQTTVVTIRPEVPSISATWAGKRAVFVSDTHLGRIRGAGFAARLTERINELRPDVIFVGGDVFDGVSVDAPSFVAPFARLSAPLGTYFVTGNHEEFRDADRATYVAALRGIGWRVLENEAVDVLGVRVAGLNDKDSMRSAVFRQTLPAVLGTSSLPTILLKHAPTDIPFAAASGVSLQLSGHTHRGQQFPYNVIARLVYGRFSYGLNTLDHLSVYTSSGAGTWGPPVRVGSHSEIILIQF